MRLLRALGFGKDPHVAWMIHTYGAKPKEVIGHHHYHGAPRHQLWQGEADGVPLTFYTEAGKHQGGDAVYLAKAGPRFVEGVSEYRCFFYRPQRLPSISIDDPRWASAAGRAMEDAQWCSFFPPEAFELGVAVGSFALELDGPLDPRPVFAYLETLRGPLDGMSAAVVRVYLYPAGVAVDFAVERLTKEKLVSDVERALAILRLTASMG